jgi:hypothetical protein
MSDQNVAAPGSVPQPQSITTPASPPPAPPPPAPTEPSEKPAWLDARLDQAKKAAIRDQLGVDPEEAKRIVAEHNARIESAKAAEVRAAELKTKAEQLEAQANEQHKVIAEHAARQMVGLTAEQIAAVKEVAGDDPAKQLRAIGALAPTWAKAAPGQTQQQASAPPATTAPPPNAPPAASTSPANNRAAYQDLRARNPFAAAAFGKANPDAYGGGNEGQ